jgi:dephospho-CoA kinase
MNLITRPTRIWGLTGGVASGKSTVAKFFSEFGFPVIDADSVSRELSREGGEAHELIIKRLGTADRAALRELIFRDAKKREELEAILHPLIARESRKRMDEHSKAGAKLIIYEASLLVETGRYKDFEGLIVVDSPRDVRKNRLILRNSFSENLADQIINAQAQDQVRLDAASRVFENNSSLEDLRQKVRQFLVAEQLFPN